MFKACNVLLVSQKSKMPGNVNSQITLKKTERKSNSMRRPAGKTAGNQEERARGRGGQEAVDHNRPKDGKEATARAARATVPQ